MQINYKIGFILNYTLFIIYIQLEMKILLLEIKQKKILLYLEQSLLLQKELMKMELIYQFLMITYTYLLALKQIPNSQKCYLRPVIQKKFRIQVPFLNQIMTTVLESQQLLIKLEEINTEPTKALKQLYLDLIMLHNSQIYQQRIKLKELNHTAIIYVPYIL